MVLSFPVEISLRCVGGTGFFSLAAHNFFHYLFLKVKRALPISQDFTYMAGKKMSSLFWHSALGIAGQTALHPEEAQSTGRREQICGLGTGLRCKRVEFHSWPLALPVPCSNSFALGMLQLSVCRRLPRHRSQKFCREKFIVIKCQRKIVAWKTPAASTCFCAYSQMEWALLMVEGR